MWTSKGGVRVLIDPFGNSPKNRWFVRPFPSVTADVVLVTHDHFDHNAIGSVSGDPTVLRGPGVFSSGDVVVRGVADLHAGTSGRAGMRNMIFTVECDDVRYCHIGDNRHDIPASVWTQLGEVDVLMVTVDDSCHLLTYEQVAALVQETAPGVVVPMHYYVDGLTTGTSTLETSERWLADQLDVRRLEAATVDIGRGDLPDGRQVWAFGPPAVYLESGGRDAR